jgi:hypothetical protein
MKINLELQKAGHRGMGNVRDMRKFGRRALIDMFII